MAGEGGGCETLFSPLGQCGFADRIKSRTLLGIVAGKNLFCPFSWNGNIYRVCWTQRPFSLAIVPPYKPGLAYAFQHPAPRHHGY